MRRSLGAVCRKRAATAGIADAHNSPEQVPARYTDFHELVQEVGDMRVGSLFEAKSGHSPCLLATTAMVRGKEFDLIDNISKSLPVKGAFKTLDQYLKQANWGVQEIEDNAKGKRVLGAVRKAFDPMVFSTLPVNVNSDWGKAVFRPTFMGLKKYFINVNYTPFGCMEARLAVDGSETIIGFMPDDVPPLGDNWKEKREWLQRANIQDIKNMLTTKGWVARHDEKHLLVLPSGYLCVTISEGCKLIRWSLSSDARDTARVTQALGLLIQHFAELRTPSSGYLGFQRYLQDA